MWANLTVLTCFACYILLGQVRAGLARFDFFPLSESYKYCSASTLKDKYGLSSAAHHLQVQQVSGSISTILFTYATICTFKECNAKHHSPLFKTILLV